MCVSSIIYTSSFHFLRFVFVCLFLSCCGCCWSPPPPLSLSFCVNSSPQTFFICLLSLLTNCWEVFSSIRLNGNRGYRLSSSIRCLFFFFFFFFFRGVQSKNRKKSMSMSLCCFSPATSFLSLPRQCLFGPDGFPANPVGFVVRADGEQENIKGQKNVSGQQTKTKEKRQR